MTRILITGGAGFIGSHLVTACIAAGNEVHAIVRPGSDDRRLRHEVIPDGGARLLRHELDLLDDASLHRCVAAVQPELIFHLAARPRRPESPDFEDARQTVSEDLLGLIGLLDAAAAARFPPRRLVRTGSLAEYGAAPSPYDETCREAPLTPYAAGLVAATQYCAALARRLPFPTATARLALTYGPAQSPEYLLPLLIQRCLDGAPVLIRHPLDRRDLVHVDDVVDALLRLGTASVPNAAILNIASGVAPTMRALADLVLEHTGADPSLISYGADADSSGAADFRGTTGRARAWLDWKPRTALAEGIAGTVAWYREEAARHAPRPCHLRLVHSQASEVSP